LIQHPDCGSQYTANAYLALLKDYGIQVSISGKGDPYYLLALRSTMPGIVRASSMPNMNPNAKNTITPRVPPAMVVNSTP
jgi:hypothetical protein